MRILFMGTPYFALSSLQHLIDHDHHICGVFTRPDRPKGRGHKLTPPPVKELALKHSIQVYQPISLHNKEIQELIRKLNPDLIAVVAYGQILPKEILTYPNYGCVNVHASLLPKYRGAAPIQWSVINGEKKTGVTTIFMEEGLDTGDILMTEETFIHPYETSLDLHDRLSIMGAKLLHQTIHGLIHNVIHPKVQNHDHSTYAPMIHKHLGEIDWNQSAKNIHNLVRGLCSSPAAYTHYNNDILKIHKTEIIPLYTVKGMPGEIVDTKSFLVSCGDGSVIQLTEVQSLNRKRNGGSEFLCGHPVCGQVILGRKEE